MNSLVTVVITIFNRFDLADRAIESIIHQSYSNWELVVIDDFSSSIYALPIFCEKYKNKIRVIRNSINQGPGLSRQKGVENSQGEFICFLDSDDFYNVEFLARSLAVHKSHPEISATYTIAQYIGNNEIRKGSNNRYTNLMPTLFLENRPWPTCALLWKRKFVASWKELRTNQDSLFEIDCSFLNNKIEHVPQILCFIDKNTGANATDLVKEIDILRQRNYVANYALENWKNIKIAPNDKRILLIAILNRIIIVSSKLIGLGVWDKVLINSLNIVKHKPFHSLVLVFFSCFAVIPNSFIRKMLKRMLERKVIPIR